MSNELQLVELVKEATKASTTQALTTEQLLRVISDEVVPNQIGLQEKMDNMKLGMTKCHSDTSCVSQIQHAYDEQLRQFVATMKQLSVILTKVNSLLSFFKILGIIIGSCTMLVGAYKLLAAYFKGG